MKALLILVLSTSGWLFAQQSSYNIPKYSPSYKRTSRDIGPSPGSKVPEGGQGETFKRIYSQPAGMRLLVRTNCGTELKRRELIARAKKISLAKGPVVQIDWEPIRGDKVTFWAVASAQRKISTIEVQPGNGKYVAGDKKVTAQEHWEVARLGIGVSNINCVVEKEMVTKDLRDAVINFLNRFSVDFFRRKSTDVGAGG